MSKEKHLNKLVGKSFTSCNLTTSTTLPINGNGKEIFTVANTLHFGDYRLAINNPISIVPTDMELEGLIGYKIVATDERKHEAELTFENGYKLLIDMRDESYYDPESMVLNGPNNFCAVWN